MRLGSDLFKRIESACYVGYLSALFEVNHHLNLEINTTIGFTSRVSWILLSLWWGALEIPLPPDYKGNLHPAVYKIKSILYSFNKSGRRVGLYWIPAHKSIPGNESADAAAKEALLLPDSLMIAKCYYTNLYFCCKKDAKSDATNIIKSEAENKGSRYFNKSDTKLAPPWYEATGERLPRPLIVLVSRLRSFYVCVDTHLSDKNIISDPACSCGHGNQTINHVFFDCPLLSEHTETLISDLYRADPLVNLDIPSINVFKKY
ncbi:uncharacterized protein [Polyergus mexicanus]|uniref:uncharacterized protein n=1 Tax=Polyergus mexicanus TaxID=615972 RepID=UPI0038B4BA36